MRVLGFRKLSGYYLVGALLASAALAGCPRPLVVDYHTEVIAAGENELQGKTLYFMPDGSLSFYSRTVIDGVTEFPVSPDEAEEVDFTEADPFEVVLDEGLEIIYYGQVYDRLFISSDGSIALGEPGSGNATTVDHFGATQVSLLPVNASNDNGSVTYQIFENEIVVTFANILVGNTSNSFQAEFFVSGAEDGDLALSYPVVSENVGGVVGLSNGQLAGANQAQIDAFLEAFAESTLVENNTGTSKLGA